MQNIPVDRKLYQGKIMGSVTTFTDGKPIPSTWSFLCVFCFYLAKNDFLMFCFAFIHPRAYVASQLSRVLHIFLNTGRKHTSASRPYYFSENGKWWSDPKLLSKYLEQNKVIKLSWTWSQNFDICCGIIFDCHYQILFLKGRLGTEFSFQPIWRFS